MGIVHFSDQEIGRLSEEKRDETFVDVPLEYCGGYGETFTREALEKGCFHCGKKFDPAIEHSVIFWDGHDATSRKSLPIFLHGRCALSLVVRLMSDYHKWETTFRQGKKDILQVRQECREEAREEREEG